ncbi:hypothetical protein BS50DRAFT_672718 [Corynespora cassiicola Philippines]|uniref:DUF7708 domain-containing protein n=1 Tax=Corynespora cassiicola Philippines TaxID=1448308 RepID=A0A2T2P2Q8_CORCC|nr:hypothetical protein BS50DRAFT_672718 [Corynespora cassiicola Philippines]
MDEEFEDRRLVRIYSFHAKERNPEESDAHALACVLSQNEPSLEDIKKPWRHFFEPWDENEPEKNPITSVLSTEAGNLQKAWQEFQRQSPHEERIEINNSEPTPKGFIAVVESAAKIWQKKREMGKRGKATGYFHRICDTIDAHSNILELVPRGNEYVSLFTGTITSIVKASVNHEQIAEELGRAICEVSEHVAECDIELKLYRTEEITRAVADLYAHVFLFLGDTLQWYMKKRRQRLRDSFNEKFSDELHKAMDQIKGKSERIRRMAAHGTAAEQRVSRLVTEATFDSTQQLGNDIRLGLQNVERRQAETSHNLQLFSERLQRERTELREGHKRLMNLQENLFKYLHHSVKSRPLEVAAQLFIGGTPLSQSDFNPSYHTRSIMAGYQRSEILANSANLEDFFHRDRVRLSCDRFLVDLVDTESMSRIVEWTMADEAHMLYIAGPYFEGDEFESSEKFMAAKFVEFASDSRVPVASYFCELRRRESLIGDETMEMRGATQLVYGLIRQLLEFMPLEFESSTDFSAERFEVLQGSEDGWRDALRLLGDIADSLPRQVICVINGLNWLDSRDTATRLSDLVATLRKDKLKVLFTAAGESRTLLKVLSRSEVFISDSPLAGSQGRFEEAHMLL